MPEIIITGWPAILIAFISALVVTWYYIPRVIHIVRQRHLEDTPEKHKIHKNNVPTLGGIGIFAGFLIGYLLGIDGYMPGLSYFTAAAVMLFFVGIKDDLVNINYNKKLLGEVGSAMVVVLFTDLRFTSFHGFLGIEEISFWVSFPVTVFTIVLIINAVNLIDGIDGLAASIGIVASVTFGVFFYLSGDYAYTVMAAALLGALLAFLRFNLSDGRFKIFMGDTGSLVIGFTLAVFAVHFNEVVAAGRSVVAITSAPSVAIGILIVPLFDTLRVIILRLRYHQSPFQADHRHIHHTMLRAGFTHKGATLLITLFNILMIGVSFLLDGIGTLWLGLVLLSLCLLATMILMRFVAKRESGIIPTPDPQGI
jgi:UDP-N-acetylmuramyl pentapeptide phosphotransferase/UDP-N-acetylglucosamine-1-phosphate transferase